MWDEWSNSDLNCGGKNEMIIIFTLFKFSQFFLLTSFLVDHSVSQPIPMQRRPGSFPGNETSGGLLSPKSAENLGLKLVNYILDDNSPSVKELETRLKNVKLNYVSKLLFFLYFFASKTPKNFAPKIPVIIFYSK